MTANPTYVCQVPVSRLRSMPTHQSEMVSQLVFGDRCQVLSYERDQWVKIKIAYDGYEGWVTPSHLAGPEEAQPDGQPEAFTTKWSTRVLINGKAMHLPLGACLTGIKKGQLQLGNNLIGYSGPTMDPQKIPVNRKLMQKFAFLFLNTPYLWGGKTVFGVDCSGFTQSLFRLFNIKLLRDAHQQASQGVPLDPLSQGRFGDLAFFDNPKGRITHVGVLLGNGKIMHASGHVRIDALDDQGIINQSNFMRTHQLKQINRYM